MIVLFSCCICYDRTINTILRPCNHEVSGFTRIVLSCDLVYIAPVYDMCREDKRS